MSPHDEKRFGQMIGEFIDDQEFDPPFYLLAIGANGAIFSLINAVMLRTLPVKEPERLVQIARIMPDGQPVGVSSPMFEYFRDRLQSVSGVSAHWSTDLAVAIDGDEEFVTADLVSGAYYIALGLDPIAGRLLTPADDDPASATSAAAGTTRIGTGPGMASGTPRSTAGTCSR